MAPIESECDRESFLIDDSVEVTIRGHRLCGIFDAAYLPLAVGSVDVESSGPSLSNCLTSVVERIGVQKDDSVEGLDKPYLVKRIEPDGTGITLILLKEA